jgi:hypothetical protein
VKTTPSFRNFKLVHFKSIRSILPAHIPARQALFLVALRILGISMCFRGCTYTSLLVVIPNEDKKIVERTRRYTRDNLWVHDNYQALIKLYNKKYVAALDKKVCFNSDDMSEMVSNIKKSNKIVEDYALWI